MSGRATLHLAPGASMGDRLHMGALGLARAALAPFRHRGLGVYCRTAGRLFGARAPVIEVRLPGGGRFAMPLYDLSWQSYLYRNRPYEPEIAAFVDGLGDLAFDWLDCGANFGYWSARLAGRAATGIPGRIVAVEPSPACLPVLRRTAALNAPHVDLVEKALHRTADGTVDFLVSDVHVASHALEAGEAPGEGRVVSVPTVSLDALAAEFGLGARPVVVKLDVEGQEANAIAGAGRLADMDTVYLYEDHGKDPDCQASAWLAEQGFSLFALDPDGTRPMPDIPAVAAFKTRPTRGYNFAATRSGFWLGHLQRAR